MAFARLTRNLAPQIGGLFPTIICYILNYSSYRMVSVQQNFPKIENFCIRDSKASSCHSFFLPSVFLVLFIHLFISSCFLFIRCPCLFLLSLFLVYLICFMHWGNHFARVPVIHPISLRFYCDSCFLLVIRLHYVLL